MGDLERAGGPCEAARIEGRPSAPRPGRRPAATSARYVPADQGELERRVVGVVAEQGVGQVERGLDRPPLPTGTPNPRWPTRPSVLHGGAHARPDDDGGPRQAKLLGSTPAPFRVVEHEVGEVDRAGVVAVDADRPDPPVDQLPGPGRLISAGSSSDGAGLGPRNEAAIGAGNGGRRSPSATKSGSPVRRAILLDEAAGLAEDRQVPLGRDGIEQVGRRPGVVALGLVIEGPVRLDEADGHPGPGGEGPLQRDELAPGASGSRSLPGDGLVSTRPNPSRSG